MYKNYKENIDKLTNDNIKEPKEHNVHMDMIIDGFTMLTDKYFKEKNIKEIDCAESLKESMKHMERKCVDLHSNEIYKDVYPIVYMIGCIKRKIEISKDQVKS